MSEYPNIIFIVVDTLRKDYAKLLEDVLRDLGFISYDNVIAPASWTLPSHASMFTGLYPAWHGAHETRTKKHINVKLNKHRELLISRQLKKMGYKTYLLTANPFITPYFGFDGFEWWYCTPFFRDPLSEDERRVLNEILKKEGNDSMNKINKIKILLRRKQYKLLFKIIVSYLYMNTYARIMGWPKDKGAKLIKAKIRRLNFSRREPTFIFINLMEVHDPYLVNEKVSSKDMLLGNVSIEFVKLWRKKYEEQVRYVSRQLIEILKTLREKGVFNNNSLVIITSDHGQLLGEHGNKLGHGTYLYDELLRVPLFVKYPESYKLSMVDRRLVKENKYFSLAKIKAFIWSIINGDFDLHSFYSETAYAESYGLHVDITPASKVEEKIISSLEKYRIAIYYKGFKGVFNVTDWSFEELVSYDPRVKITNDIIDTMKSKIIRFLKSATLAKSVRRK